MEDFNTIELLNWDEYQEKRKGVKHPGWFRMDHYFAFDPEWSHLDGEEKWVFVYILCTASMKNRSSVSLTAEAISIGAKVSLEKISSSIRKLTEKGTLRVRHMHATRPRRARDSVQQDRTGQTGQDKTDSAFDFDALWKKYPRRVNKTEARARFLRLIRTQADFDALDRAVQNYAADVEARGTEEKYVKHMSSFLGTEEKQVWRDWIEPETPPDGPGGPTVDIGKARAQVGRA